MRDVYHWVPLQPKDSPPVKKSSTWWLQAQGWARIWYTSICSYVTQLLQTPREEIRSCIRAWSRPGSTVTQPRPLVGSSCRGLFHPDSLRHTPAMVLVPCGTSNTPCHRGLVGIITQYHLSMKLGSLVSCPVGRRALSATWPCSHLCVH
jgi:hypothetical protein